MILNSGTSLLNYRLAEKIGEGGMGEVWKAPAAGGESSVLADIRLQLTGVSSASWCPDGKIVMTTGESGVMRVSSSGGDLTELVSLDKDKETDLHDATCLPDGSVLFVSHVAAGRIRSGSSPTDAGRNC